MANKVISMAHKVGTLTTPELVSEAYGKARELEHSFPDISRLLNALSTRLDVRNVLAESICKGTVKRFEPDYQMHMNHEMAYMRECSAGRYVQFAVLADLVEQNAHLHLMQSTIALALNLPGQRNFSAEVIECALGSNSIQDIREIQAQGCEMFIEFNRKLAKDYPTAMVAKALEVTELNGEQFAARIRAGEQP